MGNKTLIPETVAFPADAESNAFFCALATALLPALGYTEETPFYCAPKGSDCVNCGNCKNKTTLQKHHLQLYHDFQTFTGVSLGWVWPEDGSEYHTLPERTEGWRWPDGFFGFIFGYAGLTWKRFREGTGKDEIYAAVKNSINSGFPVLMKLGNGQDWHTVSGYDENATLYGHDSRKHFSVKMRPAIQPERYTDDGLFVMQDWYPQFKDAVVITGKCKQTIGFNEILLRLIKVLSHPVHAKLENDLMDKIDGINAENARETAQWLLDIVSFPIEARWHAADSSLNRLSDNRIVNEKLFPMIRQYVFDRELDATHGTCWKIWAQMDVGTKTGYKLTENSAEMILKPETGAELKRLFAIVFANDRIVLDILKEAAALSGLKMPDGA